MTQKVSVIRHFSESFKREKVQLYQEGKVTAIQIQRMYNVSETSVYKWIKKYGTLPKGERMVVEKESEQLKVLYYMEKVAELERALGQLHLELLYSNEVINQASLELGIDIKKKYKSQSCRP
jgi:transposase-like protein